MQGAMMTQVKSLFCVLLTVSAITKAELPQKHWTVHEGLSITLPCPLDKPFVEINWFMPNGTEVTDTLGDMNITKDTSQALVISEARPAYSGEFVCILKQQDAQSYSAITTLEVVPAPVFLSAWDENRPRVIRGGIAAGVLVFAVSSLCLIYKFRWKKPNSKPPVIGDGTDGGQKLSDVYQHYAEEGNVSSVSKVSSEMFPSSAEEAPTDLKEAPDDGDKGVDKPTQQSVPEIKVQYAVEQEQELGSAADLELDGEAIEMTSQKPKRSEDSPKGSPDVHDQTRKNTDVQVQYAAERQLSVALESEIQLPSNEQKNIDSPKN